MTAMMKRLAKLFARGEMALSEASTRDAASIAALHAASFHRGWSEEEVESLLTDRQVCAHRVGEGASLAGFIMSRRAGDEAEVLSVAVARARRGRGLGRRLLDLHLRWLAARGVRVIFLEVDEHNTAALRLYRGCGFHEVGQRPNYYRHSGGTAAAARVLRRDL